mmetsp:Transcript_22480/g.36983  ORF Transcript_22480/g.36983 Transcript_22480/m.36983 type:complete len:237 (-) Transcript_22480:55-765(-)
MERFEFVGLYRRLILVQMCQWVLGPVVMRVIVCINSLRLKACDGVELLDGCGTKPGESPEHGALDLSYLRILHSVHERVLRLRSMVLELLRGVLLSERGNLVEVHLQIMCHLLCEIIFRSVSPACLELDECWCSRRCCLAFSSSTLHCSGLWPLALQELAEERGGSLGPADRLQLPGALTSLGHLLLEDLRILNLILENINVCIRAVEAAWAAEQGAGDQAHAQAGDEDTRHCNWQ